MTMQWGFHSLHFCAHLPIYVFKILAVQECVPRTCGHAVVNTSVCAVRNASSCIPVLLCRIYSGRSIDAIRTRLDGAKRWPQNIGKWSDIYNLWRRLTCAVLVLETEVIQWKLWLWESTRENQCGYVGRMIDARHPMADGVGAPVFVRRFCLTLE